MSPLLRRMSSHPELEVRTAYCTLHGAEPVYDPDFNVTVQWDVPLLDGYSWVQVPNKGNGEKGFFRFCNPGLWELIREGRFDAVVCYTGYVCASFWITYLACRLAGTPFLFGTDAVSVAPRDGSRWKGPVKKLWWPILFRLADQVLAQSSRTYEMLMSLGVPASLATRVPSVVNNDWWTARSAQVDRDAIRSSWGATPGTAVILFCAKLQPWKRPNDLLQAFAAAGLPDALLVFAGDGSLRPQLEAEAARLGLAGRVLFLGFVNQSRLPECYAAADLMVLPSDYEPFGLVVNEAMLCGCLVSASDRVGATRDLIEPVDPALIFPYGDVQAIARVIRQVFADRERLRQQRESARRRMETWSPKEYVEAVLEAVRRSRRQR